MVASEFRRALRAYVRAVIFAEPVQLELLRRHGITFADLRALRILRDLGRVPISHYADALGISRSTATGLVDRFEERGLLAREASTTDRRVTYVAITVRGRHALEDRALFDDSTVGQRIAALTPEQQRQFADLIEVITGTTVSDAPLGATPEPALAR